MTERVAIIGDVHGELGPLTDVVAQASRAADRLIFVGDYVNRGRHSADVVEYLVRLRASQPSAVFLAGNHDLAFRDALHGAFDRFLQLGGAATVRSYVKPPYGDVERQFIDAVPDTHRAFLASMEIEFRLNELHVAHQPPAERPTGCFGVYGHVPQPRGVPAVTEDAALIDTGCGVWADGRLTCFLWPSRTWLQA